MIHKLVDALDKKIGFDEAEAHCDIPCGIYDPITAQISALTVVRMVDLLNGLDEKYGNMGIEYKNSLTRYVASKEEHAENAKHEVRIIWGDYIKANHLEKYPNLHEVVHNIMQLGSKSRQTVDREAGGCSARAQRRNARSVRASAGEDQGEGRGIGVIARRHRAPRGCATLSLPCVV